MLYDLYYHTKLTRKAYKWRFKEYPHLLVTEDGVIVDQKTGREKKIKVNGYSKGIWVGRKFLTNLNQHLEKITPYY